MPISQDQLDAWKRLALDVRERMHLQYAREGGQFVPLEMLIAVRFALPSLGEEVEKLREALRPFAKSARELDDDNPPDLCVEDSASIERALYESDQPTVGDLRRARAALDETTPPLTTTPEG